MTPEELEQTEQMKTMIIETETDDEEQSVLEMIEEFEDKIEYLDIPKDKKKKLIEMCEEIKNESDEKVREYLFNLLQKEID